MCEDHGYGEYSCECVTGWAGNGVLCAVDTDLDKWPDTQLPCNERNCKQVSSSHVKIFFHSSIEIFSFFRITAQ